LARQGLPAWTVNDAQVCRAGAFADRVGRLNDFGGSKFAAWVLNAHCANHVPVLTPTTGGRMLAFTDWLAPAWTGSPAPTPARSPTLSPSPVSTPPPTPNPTASPMPSPTETAAPSPSATVAPSATASPSPSPTPTLDPVIGAIESSDLSASDQALLEALYRRLLP
ncbi:MAG TPA: hypothetical protein VFW92_06825, partial [Candidatus Limnocylindrales bacterium]|nr:hypothetical protein [Candidatus Limnocylindrales bacterium]